MITLIRDLFVTEEADGLVLGLGVPKTWLKPGARFGVTKMPTDFGPVSYSVTVGDDGKPKLEYDGPQKYRLALSV